MANGSLNEYVRMQLQRGYPPESIRSALIQAGYNPQDVDFALRTTVQPARRVELSGKGLALIAGALLTVILLVFSGYLLFGGGPKDVQLAVRVQPEQLFAGDTLSVTVTLASEQSREAQVDLEYVVYEPFSRRTVTTRSERVLVGESAFTVQRIDLPATLQPAEYEARVTAKFERLSRVQSAKFTVQLPVVEEEEEAPPVELPPLVEVEPVEEELECPASFDDLNPATTDSCVRGSCVHEFASGVCGNGECEPGETRLVCPEDCGAAQDKEAIMQSAVQQSKSNAEKAATLCNSLVLPEDSDPCFAAIANASKKSQLCLNVQTLRTRDDCLMEFAFSGDYSVCNQLSNRYLLTSCQSLARFSTVQQETQEAEAQAQQIAQEAAEE
jgi:hypothetical protein